LVNNFDLRLRIGTAVLLERRRELKPKPQGRFLVDFESPDDPKVGITKLESAVNRLVVARHIDPFAPDVHGSSILYDVAIFMAKLEEPHHIFTRAAKETAILVGGRVLRYEGWNAVADYFGTWQKQTRAIDPATSRNDRVTAYVRLFKSYWEPNGAPFLDVFDKYDSEA
jgi:hypothetical protein